MPVQNVATRGQLRGFLQLGGPGLNNPLSFSGVNAGYIEMAGVKHPIVGGADPISVFNPQQAQQFVRAGKMVKAPGFVTATMSLYELVQGIPTPEILGSCPFNYYEVKGACADLSNFLTGWQGGYVRVYSQIGVLDDDPKDRAAWEKDDPLQYDMSVYMQDEYAVGSLSFGEQALTLTNEIVKDVVYGSALVCGNCGTPNSGDQFIYASMAANTTSPGAKPNVAYTTNGGQTWTKVQVASAAIAEDLIAIAIIGDKLVVLSKTGGGSSTSALHYATIGASGAPGTWTKVTTGFIGGNPANDIYVQDPNNVFLPADGGYIYKIASGGVQAGVIVNNAAGTTTQNLLRMHGNGTTTVAVGAASAIIVSQNGGKTWAATTSAPVAATIMQAIAVVGDTRYWVGTATGRLFNTIDGGISWTEYVLDGSSASITDILFATDEVGYVASMTSGPVARIFATFNGGNAWTNVAPRINNLSTIVDATRLAVPVTGRTALKANNLAIGGTKTAGTLGVISLGTAQYL